ncbi:hypothetical protein RvY_13451 [Ramazzottius varieornatus]|uniref:Chromo domain-containing protein n=1 Tax=Ramazzottius varieornatus TaxID=947166 RepID=A0A1D1VMV9_RAMVA|nr:hypothetical protein RvY_13451 [Ramazzottius varieornatus]
MSDNVESIKTVNQFRSSSHPGENRRARLASFEDGHVAEKILKRKAFARGGVKRAMYLVKWLGSDQHTWEPRHHFGENNDAWVAFQQERRKRNRRRPVMNNKPTATKVTFRSRRRSLSTLQQKIRKSKMSIPSVKESGISEMLVNTGAYEGMQVEHRDVGTPVCEDFSTVAPRVNAIPSAVKEAAQKNLSSTRVIKPVRMVGCKTMVSRGCNTTLTCLKARSLLVEPKAGMSALETGTFTGTIVGYKPREAGIRTLDDLSFMLTYAGREPEFVDYKVCMEKIPEEVAQFLFKNKVFTLESAPDVV